MIRLQTILLLLAFFCISDLHAQITVDPPTGMPDQSFTVTITGTDTEFMQGTTTCIEFSLGTTTYNLTDVMVESETSLTGNLATPADAALGAYDVTVYLGPNCDSTEWSCDECFSVIECDLAAAAAGTDITCAGESDGMATIEITGAVGNTSTAWSNNMTGETIAGLAAGDYGYTVTDDAGCTTEGMVRITEPDQLIGNIASKQDVTCFGASDGTIDLEVTGGTGDYTYTWDNDAGTEQDPSGLAGGTFTVQISDENNCMAMSMAMIEEPDSLVLTLDKTDISALGLEDGTAVANASGGTGTISYLWNTGAITASIDGLAAGTYTVTATDENGCVIVDSVTILGVDCNLQISSETVAVLCAGDSTGSISYTVTNASDRVSISLNGMEVPEDGVLMGLPAGPYEAFVFDSVNACSATLNDTITQPDSIDIVIDSIAGDTGSGNGSIMATVNGGKEPFTFTWTQDGNVVGMSEDLENLSAGNYVLQVVDANGCEVQSDTVSVEMTTSILELEGGALVRIFPNPTQDQLRIDIESSDLRFSRQFSLFDYSGQLVKIFPQDTQSLDLSDLAKGSYLIKMEIEGKPYFSKIVKL